jgi:hypothetical protein
MNTTMLVPGTTPHWSAAAISVSRGLVRAWERERRLARYGAVLLVLLVPMAIAWALDDRTLRGSSVWIKPMKFALSISVLAFTTAWFAGHLPAARRSGRAMDWIVWLLIGAGTFELAYIALQAGLGQGSHYNVGDTLHATLFTLMGIGAVTLTATQPMLAWQLYRHPDPAQPAAHRQAMLLGLVLTFVFGAGAGALLSGGPPPEGGLTMPLTGWSISGGDLRPAHFVGIHAEQVLPAMACAGTALGARNLKALVWGPGVLYALLFAVLVGWGLGGRG